MMVESSMATQESLLQFLKKYSGTHKLSELHQRYGPETRSALSNLEENKQIRYHIDTDSRFSGWVIAEDQLPEGYVPSLEGSTLPAKISKFLQNGPKTKQEIIKEFESLYSEPTIRGRLSEMSRADQLFRSGDIYKLESQVDES